MAILTTDGEQGAGSGKQGADSKGAAHAIVAGARPPWQCYVPYPAEFSNWIFATSVRSKTLR